MTFPADFRGTAGRLTEADVDRVAKALNLEPRKIWAVASVEAASHGFLADGRPDLLYEAHRFHVETGGEFDAAHPDISSPSWDPTLYGAAGAHQYDRLAEAMELDRDRWPTTSRAAEAHFCYGRDDLLGKSRLGRTSTKQVVVVRPLK